MTIHYMQIDPHTQVKSYHSVPSEDLVPEDAWIVDGLPTGDFEAHCPIAGDIVCDVAAKADADAGPQAIAAAHARKSVEASLIIAGYDFDGLVRAEAALRGVSELELAHTIKERSDEAVVRELERISLKNGLSAISQEGE